MIILSIGMPRAGSGWYYNLTNDLMLSSGAQDPRQVRQRYHLQKVLTEVNCNIGALTPRRVLAVLVPSLLGNTFVIKAHAGPTPVALALIRLGFIRPTYIYRDPRDALLSAMENGRRAAEQGRTNAFTPLVDFDTAVDFMLDAVHVWEGWMACDQALHARYEDLLTDYDLQVERLTAFLRLDRSGPGLQQVIDRYRPEVAQPDQKGIHFSQGKIGRFRQKMSPDQQQVLTSALQPYLSRMGYAR
jgi:Sulfotransferase domain